MKILTLFRNVKMAATGASVLDREFSPKEMEWLLSNIWSETLWEESYYGWFSLHVPWDTPRRELAGQLIVVAEDDK